MELINFRLSGRFAHFLRAEASASALSYPVPPRTVILGIMGAVLGLPKDKPQIILEPANISILGKLPKTHWHRAKFRQTLPASIPLVVKKTEKGTSKDQKEPKLILQEWLFEPDYTVWVSIPLEYHAELKDRLLNRKWYFSPSLGLSEMMADIEYLGTNEAMPLPKDTYDVHSIFQHEAGILETNQIFERGLAVHSFRMPRLLTSDRIFNHSAYFAEHDGKPIPVKTDQAHKVNDKVLMFL